MELYYQGVNITKSVSISSAKCRDVSCGRSDSVDLVFEKATAWHRWQPKTDDMVEVVHKNYSTGAMYVNTVISEDGKYRIIATAQKKKTQNIKTKSFEGYTLEEIVRFCAAECDMDYRIFGINGCIRYPYLLRSKESCAAFLDRISAMEGAVLKTYAGRFTMIDIVEAQKLPAIESIELFANRTGTTYQRKAHKLKTLTVKTPYASATAVDRMVKEDNRNEICDFPATDAATAIRWAAGTLLNKNRKAEILTVQTNFRAAWSAMVRVDVTGDTEANGKWIIDEVEHDFVADTSKAVLFRVTESVST